MGMSLNTKELRLFFQTLLNDTQLRTFVLDHFPPIYSQISAWGQSYTDRILLLIDFCYRQGEIEEMTAALARDFPDQMALFLEEMGKLSEGNPTAVDKNEPDDRLEIPPPDSWSY